MIVKADNRQLNHTVRRERLSPEFYLNDDVVMVARQLLGKYLVTNIGGITTSGKIVETEAYRGPDDKACHAYAGRFTKRTSVMYEPGGKAYVYLCYGIHHLFNVVTGPENIAHAVLIRAVEACDNVESMLARRKMNTLKPQLSAGPGVMSKSLGITTAYTGLDLTGQNTPIWIENRGGEITPAEIATGPRIGVDYAGQCALWDWRFWIKGNEWVSRH